MGEISIIPVEKAADREAFVRLPFRLYKDDPHWVPPLLSDARKSLSRSNPFFESGDAQLFLARRRGEIVGRISAQVSRRHLAKHDDKRGFFGWFESEDDSRTSDALFGAAIDWILSRNLGLTHVRGPFNWDINGEAPGVLIPEESEPGLPVVLMAHNPPHYSKLVEAAGFRKCQDFYAYRADSGPDTPAMLAWLDRLSDASRKRLPSLKLRQLDLGKGYLRDMEVVRRLFNSAWAQNWGAIDLSEAEMAEIAGGLKPIARSEITCIAEVDGEPIGCLVCIPDVNPILKRLKGHLLPFGWVHLLMGLKKLTRFRTILLGVSESYRGRGLDAVMMADVIRRGLDIGFKSAEMSWVLESNLAMNGISKKVGRRYRTYRVYEREL